jgi:integrase
LYAATSLMLFAGLRCGEATSLLVRDWAPGADPKLTVRGLRPPEGRTIRVAPSAAAAIDGYLAGEETEPDEPLLIGLRPNGIPHFLPKVFRDAMRRAGLDVSVHDLRRAAEAAVLEDGTPVAHVDAYFGMSKAAGQPPTSPPEGYDRGIAEVLERTFRD